MCQDALRGGDAAGGGGDPVEDDERHGGGDLLSDDVQHHRGEAARPGTATVVPFERVRVAVFVDQVREHRVEITEVLVLALELAVHDAAFAAGLCWRVTSWWRRRRRGSRR
jgi:hypothetical protein